MSSWEGGNYAFSPSAACLASEVSSGSHVILGYDVKTDIDYL